MDDLKGPAGRITSREVESYKREVLEQSVLIGTREAGRVLGRSPRHVVELVRDGALDGYNDKPGSKGLRVLASQLRDYVRDIKIDKNKWRE